MRRRLQRGNIDGGRNILERGRQRGVGLNNVEQRLRSYCGAEAGFSLETIPGQGAIATIRLPLTAKGQVAMNEIAAARRSA